MHATCMMIVASASSNPHINSNAYGTALTGEIPKAAALEILIPTASINNPAK